jgi:hypothetical protein
MKCPQGKPRSAAKKQMLGRFWKVGLPPTGKGKRRNFFYKKEEKNP